MQLDLNFIEYDISKSFEYTDNSVLHWETGVFIENG